MFQRIFRWPRKQGPKVLRGIAVAAVVGLTSTLIAVTGSSAHASGADRDTRSGASAAGSDGLVTGRQFRDGTYISPAANTGCGSTCDFKNPATYKIYHSGCATCYHYCADDAITPYSAPSPPVPKRVELRYSPRCRTAWARLTDGGGGYYPETTSYYLDGRVRTVVTGSVPTGAYTQMLNDANLEAMACAWYGPSGYCTRRY